MISPFDKAVIAAMKKDSKEHTVQDFSLRYVLVKHEDGSEYKITHAKLERIQVKVGKNMRDCILIYPEHNTINLFVECDLESVEVKPWKGRKYKLKLNKKW
jgi:hypothetical protein